ncbi:hypothetical protein Pelo_18276 [Pelomyxa schiedti]|nr:hypothetical protein Pelo_18276 [Pelomyxa schiedti]
MGRTATDDGNHHTASSTSSTATGGVGVGAVEGAEAPCGSFVQGNGNRFDVTPSHVGYGGETYARTYVTPTVFTADDGWLYIWTGSLYHCIRQGTRIITATETGPNSFTQTNNGTVLTFQGDASHPEIAYKNKVFCATPVSPTVCYNQDGDYWYYVRTIDGLYIVNYVSNSGYCTAKPHTF